MKRILHISKYYYPFIGGTEQVARDCVNALDGLYEQKVICFNDGKESKTEFVDDVEIDRVGVFANVSSQALSIFYGKKLKDILRSYKPDIVIFHYPNPFVAYYLLRYLPSNSRLVVYWHLDIVKQKFLKLFFEGQNKRLLDRADKLIATSPNYIDGSVYLSAVHDKCVVVPNCINEERLRLTREIEIESESIRERNKGKIICLAVGRHTAYKGFQYLIESARLLNDDFQIFITGKGKETEKLKAAASGDRKIHFLGSIDDTELKAYMSAMDIFCFPSITKNEAFGLALAEAMYFGKPAVTFTIPGSGVNYVCLNGETGIEVPNRDIVQYADAMKTLANDEKLRKRLGHAGKLRVEKNFLTSQFKSNIVKLINEL